MSDDLNFYDSYYYELVYIGHTDKVRSELKGYYGLLLPDLRHTECKPYILDRFPDMYLFVPGVKKPAGLLPPDHFHMKYDLLDKLQDSNAIQVITFTELPDDIQEVILEYVSEVRSPDLMTKPGYTPPVFTPKADIDGMSFEWDVL